MYYKTNSDITLVKNGIIAHGVNRQRVMGSGVAKSLYTKWSVVRDCYMNKYPMPELGNVLEVKVSPFVSVFNCYTQEQYGYDGKPYADYDAIINSLIKVAVFVGEGKKINIPKIGSDRGGLDWYLIEGKLLKIEKELSVEFIVHTL